MDELPEVDVVTLAEIQHSHEPFTNDARQISVSQHGNLVDPLVFVVRLGHQVLIDILEVRNGHIFLELLVGQNGIVHQLNFV